MPTSAVYQAYRGNWCNDTIFCGEQPDFNQYPHNRYDSPQPKGWRKDYTLTDIGSCAEISSVKKK